MGVVMTSDSEVAELQRTLEQIAPGTELRDSLERILRGRTGALIVLGRNEEVEAISTGGFPINVQFTATRLRELAKMDGAIILDEQASTILSAGIQLTPDPRITTHETGTRHRTAERTAIQTGFPVISVSKSMQIVAVYYANTRHVLEESPALLARADQALRTLERYKSRFDEVAGTLSAVEIEDLVTVRDVSVVLQRLEMIRRIEVELDGYVRALGTDGRLVSLQLREMTGPISNTRALILQDYLDEAATDCTVESASKQLAQLSADDLLDLHTVALAAGFPVLGDLLEANVTPRGYRLLSVVPRLSAALTDRLAQHFPSLQALLSANIDDLLQVEGINEARARGVREGLSRLAETSILERYV